MAAPVVAPVYNWTGLYVGLHAGYGWADADGSVTYTPSPAAFGPAGVAPFSFSHDADGFMAGGQIGFNYQIANWVVGIEADLSWSDINGGVALGPLTTFPGLVPIVGSTYTSAYDMNWFGTVRGRLGFAANNLLIYVTGGLAYADIDYTTTAFFPATGNLFVGTASSTEAGWTFGGGFEWGLAPNWSVKAEYLYYDLGDTTVVGSATTAPPAFTTVSTIDNSGHIIRVGVNYRFGWGGPVVARY
jgi:outer membrane immunogenic protein